MGRSYWYLCEITSNLAGQDLTFRLNIELTIPEKAGMPKVTSVSIASISVASPPSTCEVSSLDGSNETAEPGKTQ